MRMHRGCTEGVPKAQMFAFASQLPPRALGISTRGAMWSLPSFTAVETGRTTAGRRLPVSAKQACVLQLCSPENPRPRAAAAGFGFSPPRSGR